ncbi:MAG: hypothetical protein IAF38_11550 [Bacteroidia bacterium]|nr:hypothetical protein [Bacteroidia bacterium]
MTEAEVKTTIEEVKEIIKKTFPDTETLLAYAQPFFEPIYPEYEKYLSALKKIGIENVETITQYIIGSPRESALKKLDPILETIFLSVLEITNSDLAVENIIRKAEEKRSLPVVIPFLSDIIKDIRLDDDEKWKELNEKVGALPEQERVIIKYFNLLLLKLYLRYAFLDSAYFEIIPKTISKQLLLNYFNGMNNLYDKEVVPAHLISYLNDIEIPDEGMLFVEFLEPSETVEPAKIPQIISENPLFHQQAKIFLELKKHFNGGQHSALKNILNGKNSSEKLLFLGKANQLADTFKKLYEEQFVTGCNKAELIKWILNNFQYKSKTKALDSTEKYLHDIISTETKFCKNPIIKFLPPGADGKKVLASTSIKSRQK